jgi:hypothetical protein
MALKAADFISKIRAKTSEITNKMTLIKYKEMVLKAINIMLKNSFKSNLFYIKTKVKDLFSHINFKSLEILKTTFFCFVEILKPNN